MTKEFMHTKHLAQYFAIEATDQLYLLPSIN